MSAVIHHVLLALAILALAQASLRVASTLSPRGLERAIVATVIAVSLAVVQTLALGLVGLGADTAALVIATGATFAVAQILLPPPAIGISAELRAWWRELPPAWRMAAAAAAGIAIAWIAWQLRYPSIGFDSSIYHYAEIAGWVHNGHPGSILSLSYDLPYGNYPITDEVAQTWGAGIARSFVPLGLWTPFMFVVLGAAAWRTLRTLDVSGAPAALGTAALLTLPLIVHQLNAPQNDLTAMTWLACTAALASGARRTPALLAPAILAAGLAVGTKTTPIVMTAGALGVGLYLARGRLRPLTGRLLIAAVGAVAVGGIWYLRNLIQHGSPLWPFVAAPWGDPVPAFLKLVNATLLAHPLATLRGNVAAFGDGLAGGVVLLGGAALALVRGGLSSGLSPALRRQLIVAGVLAVVGFLTFAIAPGTGPAHPGLAFGPLATLRYILPALGGAIVAVALATRAPGVTGRAATTALAAASAWSFVQDVRLGFPYVPPALTLVVGAAAGLAILRATAAAQPLVARWRRGGPPLPAPAVAVGLAVVVGAILAPASNGYIKRSAHVRDSTALAPELVAWFATQAGFQTSHQPIAFISRAVAAQLTGDHFTHPLELIPADADCAEVRAIARRSIVVVTAPPFLRGLIGDRPYDTGACLLGRRAAYRDQAFTVYG